MSIRRSATPPRPPVGSSSILQKLTSRWRTRSGYWQDVSWIAAGTGLAQAIGLLTMPALTRLYEPAAFASLNIFTQAVALLSGALSLRLEFAVPLPKQPVYAMALLRLVAALSLLGAALWTGAAVLAGDWIARWRPEEPQVLWLLVPITAALGSIALASQHLAQRFGHYRRVGIAEIAGKGAYFLTALLGVWALPSPTGLLLAVGVGILVKMTLTLPPQRASDAPDQAWRLQKWTRLCRTVGARYRRLSMTMVSSHLMLTLTGLIPALFVSSAYGADALGQMFLVITTSYLPSALIGSAVGQVYFQHAARRHALGQPFGDLWTATVRRLLQLGLPLYLLLGLTARWIYPWLFGPRWELAGQFAVVMSVSAFLSYLSTPLDRSCIVVSAWRYIPAWQLARLLSTCMVVGLASHFRWPVLGFVVALTVQMSLMYLIDFFAERNFAYAMPVQVTV